MRNSTIKFIVFLSLVAVIGVIVNQYLWVSNNHRIQENTLNVKQSNVQIERAQFDNKVTLALIDVRDKLLSINQEGKGLYLEPVQQITKNYFVVSFYDTLNPTILQNLIVEKFEEYNVNESFEYGIYDCFSDSIIFDKYVNLESGTSESKPSQAPYLKWNHDGHYFGVYFPERREITVEQEENISGSLLGSIVVILVVLLVLSIAIYTILKQKRLSEVKTDFINNMTHELKTPIATIALSSDVLKNPDYVKDEKRVLQYANIIHTENARLESQVERVLQLAKLEKGNIELKRESLNPNELINKALPAFQALIQQKAGKINMDLCSEEVAVYGDKLHLTNVFYNILDNAIKYSPDQPLVKIVTEIKDDYYIAKIEDNGKGLTKEQQKSIFDKFYRVPTGSVHDVKGFGLGLYYVKTIIEEHGGKVTVKSKIGEGSEFIISIPIK